MNNINNIYINKYIYIHIKQVYVVLLTEYVVTQPV